MLEPVLTRTMRNVIEVDESQSKGHEIVISVTESSSKIHKPKLYKEAVSYLVYRQQWQKVLIFLRLLPLQ